MDESSHELTTMFNSHCPDSELSLIFRCKPLQQWTAAEVHEKLVEHRRDKRHSSQPKSTTAVTMLRQDVTSGLCPSLPTGKPTSDANTGPALNQTSQEPAEPLDRILSIAERIPAGSELWETHCGHRGAQITEQSPHCHVKCVGTEGTLLVSLPSQPPLLPVLCLWPHTH